MGMIMGVNKTLTFTPDTLIKFNQSLTRRVNLYHLSLKSITSTQSVTQSTCSRLSISLITGVHKKCRVYQD
jgi:hypothetical protein